MDVNELFHSRLERQSRPGKRDDDYRLGLVIQGGGLRASILGGMVSALHNNDATEVFDGVYGSSAGAFAGAYLLAGNPQEGTTLFFDELLDRDFFSLTRYLRQGLGMNLPDLMDVIIKDLKPLDLERASGSPVALRPVAVNLSSGRVHVLDPQGDAERLHRALTASCCVPAIAGPPVYMDGQLWCDAIYHEPVPVSSAWRDGCTHVLVLRSCPAGSPAAPAGRLKREVVRMFTGRWHKSLSRGPAGSPPQLKYLHGLGGPRMLQVQAQGIQRLSPVKAQRSSLIEAAHLGYDALCSTLSLPPRQSPLWI